MVAVVGSLVNSAVVAYLLAWEGSVLGETVARVEPFVVSSESSESATTVLSVGFGWYSVVGRLPCFWLGVVGEEGWRGP